MKLRQCLSWQGEEPSGNVCRGKADRCGSSMARLTLMAPFRAGSCHLIFCDLGKHGVFRMQGLRNGRNPCHNGQPCHKAAIAVSLAIAAAKAGGGGGFSAPQRRAKGGAPRHSAGGLGGRRHAGQGLGGEGSAAPRMGRASREGGKGEGRARTGTATRWSRAMGMGRRPCFERALRAGRKLV